MREAAGDGSNRYPEAESEALQSKLADFHRVRQAHVVIGCGSSEILRIAVAAFGGAGRKVIVASPTFELVGQCARRAGADVVSVPLTRTYVHDLDAMLAQVDGRTGLVYICNPNNPTGSVTPRSDLESFIGRLPPTTRVLVDEAYHHYVGGSSDYASFIDRPVIGNPNVIVTRSFSAVYGLAGMRVGYAIAEPDIARTIASHRLPESLTSVATRAAIAALGDIDHVGAATSANEGQRQEFLNQADARMLRVIDSHTNFIMFDTEHAGSEVVEHCRNQGVLISGPFAHFDRFVRVSLGTPDDMREFWRVWDMKYGHAM
jgi:histidinol-phosphate aminotransferase